MRNGYRCLLQQRKERKSLSCDTEVNESMFESHHLTSQEHKGRMHEWAVLPPPTDIRRRWHVCCLDFVEDKFVSHNCEHPPEPPIITCTLYEETATLENTYSHSAS